ncbi:vacuolar amino acid transporter 5 [Coprinopsis marcescibilis]|uniref:Vacuolar amino acid transporter 5 n=1 Tax=Coprinopsis marcescibilis TaxID=230819 RepID=A0A5C3LAU0_COPMA|nr:vacuolar amino acid transporter 5 [Coprinopsis marcescibilis]
MVATYGVAPVNAADPSTVEDSHESRALLGGDSSSSHSSGSGRAEREKRDGHATLTSCISNLANTIIGSGMLTFPLAMASVGVLPGMLTCIFSGAVAAFGLYLLSLCATYTKHRHASFHAVSQLTFPRAAIFFDAAIATKCFGVSISYLIIIKGLMPNVVASLYHDLTGPDTNPPAWALDGGNWISIFMIILIPISFLRHLNSLRHTSYIALFSVAYLVLIVIKCYFWPLKDMPQRGEVYLIHFTPKFVSTFPIQVFAFTCAQNLFPLYNEVKNNSQKRMNIIIGGSIGTAVITYEVIAVVGYLTFGSKVGANIIAMYPSTSLFIAVGQLAIVIMVMFSYPLQVHPCRNCLDKVLHPDHVDHRQRKPATASDDQEEEDDGEDDDHAHAPMSSFKHTVLTSLIITSGFTIAYFVDDLQMVLSFVGSTGSTTISFILPGILYWKLTRGDPSQKRTNFLAICLTVYGVFIFTFCLGYNIYQVFHPPIPGVNSE